jgi:cholesterol transport system auxiliary component
MRRTILAAVAALAAGCLGGLKEEAPAPRIYRVDAPSFGAGGALAADLKVAIGPVAPGLDGSGIAGRWPGQRLDYVAGARWADDLPNLVGAALVEAFQDTGRLHSVQGDVGRFQVTHTIVVQVRRFEADYTGGGLPVAQVSLAATVGGDDGRVLAAFTVSASETTSANSQSAVVAALDAAFARAAGDLAARTFDAIAAAPAKRQAAR